MESDIGKFTFKRCVNSSDIHYTVSWRYDAIATVRSFY